MARPRRHRWIDESCTRCGLRRREVWALDPRHRPVTTVVWSSRGGPVRILPFPPMKGPVPDPPPTRTVVELFPGVPEGPEPPCVDRDG